MVGMMVTVRAAEVIFAVGIVMVVVVVEAVDVSAGGHHCGRGGRSGGSMADFVVVLERLGQQSGYAEGQVLAGR